MKQNTEEQKPSGGIMGTGRLEAFSDGVIAVIITIMVLEFRVPTAPSWPGMAALVPTFLAYLLSFVVVGIMWLNHHSILHFARNADTRLVWSNNNLLFWMSLIPFSTAFMGRFHQAPLAVATYGLLVMLTSCSFGLLHTIIASQYPRDSRIAHLFRNSSRRAYVTALIYLSSIGLAFVSVWVAYAILVLTPLGYFVQDRSLNELIENGETS